MKKFLILFIAGILTVMVVGCGAPAAEGDTKTTDTTKTTTDTKPADAMKPADTTTTKTETTTTETKPADTKMGAKPGDAMKKGN